MTHAHQSLATPPLSPREVANALRASLAVRVECTGLSPAVLRWHPAPGEWCVLEVIGHLIEAEERGFAGRVRTLLAEADPLFRSWDQNAVARERRDCEKDPASLLAEWTRLRRQAPRSSRRCAPRTSRGRAAIPPWGGCRSRISWPSGSTTTAITSDRSWPTCKRTCGPTWATPSASRGPSRDRAVAPTPLKESDRAHRDPRGRRVRPEARAPRSAPPTRGARRLPGHPRDKADFIERVKDADVVVLDYTLMDEEVLSRCPRLRFVAFLGIGYASCIDIEAATRRGIVVSNTPTTARRRSPSTRSA